MKRAPAKTNYPCLHTATQSSRQRVPDHVAQPHEIARLMHPLPDHPARSGHPMWETGSPGQGESAQDGTVTDAGLVTPIPTSTGSSQINRLSVLPGPCG